MATKTSDKLINTHNHHDLHPFAPSLGMYTNLSHDHLEQRLAHRVSSIHQNQARAFSGEFWEET